MTPVEDTQRLLKLLGRNLKKIRKSKGVSLEELSYAVEISVNTINRIEHGTYNLLLRELWRLGDYFGESPADLIRKRY